MLIGEYQHSLDTKGRVNFPAKLREDLGESFILSKGLGDECLFVYSEEEWNKLNALRILLPRALVYVYKYEPMVGVISITDPKGMTLYYEYDAKGRLAVERDGDNNVIRSYRYTLKNEK